MQKCLISLAAALIFTSPALAEPPHFPECRTDLIRSLLLSPDKDAVLVTAHRGAHAEHPENSLAAIEAAIEMGASLVEIDLRRASDGTLVLMHDDRLDRTTAGTGRVSDFTADELKEVALTLPDGRVTSEHIPTFREALAVADGRILLMLDSKVDTPDDIATIAEIVAEAGAADSVLLYDFRPLNALAYKQAIPGAPVMMRAPREAQILPMLHEHGPDVLHIDESYALPSWMQYFRDAGVPTFLGFLGRVDEGFETGDMRRIEDLVRVKPGVIQTDYPEALIALLREHELHPAALDLHDYPECR